MRFMSRLAILLLLFSFVMLPVASAQTTIDLNPIADDFAQNTDSFLDFEDTLVARGSQDPGGACISQFETFLKFDLSSITADIATATLTLRSTSVAGSSVTMQLYGSTDDTWQEGPTHITWASRPQGGSLTLLNSSQALTASGGDVVFATSTAFVDFLNQQRTGDGTATLAIILSACSNPIGGQNMSSKEGAVAPELSVEVPNAIDLRTFSADDSGVSPLIWGAALLGLVAVAGGAIVARRRMAS